MSEVIGSFPERMKLIEESFHGSERLALFRHIACIDNFMSNLVAALPVARKGEISPVARSDSQAHMYACQRQYFSPTWSRYLQAMLVLNPISSYWNFSGISKVAPLRGFPIRHCFKITSPINQACKPV